MPTETPLPEPEEYSYSPEHEVPKPNMAAFAQHFWGQRELIHEHNHGHSVTLQDAVEAAERTERAPESVPEFTPADEHNPNHPYNFLDAKNAQRRWEEYSTLLLPIYEKYRALAASGEEWAGPLADKEFLAQGYANLSPVRKDLVAKYWDYLKMPKTEMMDIIPARLAIEK